MKTVNISLTNTNYTQQAAMDVNLDRTQFELLKQLFTKLEEGLYREGENYLAVKGLMNDPVKLTVTEYGQTA